jgi:hypothetical protein
MKWATNQRPGLEAAIPISLVIGRHWRGADEAERWDKMEVC